MKNNYNRYVLAVILAISVISSKANSDNLRGNGLQFTPNKGQIVDVNFNLRPNLLYVGAGPNNDIYLREDGISYVRFNYEELKEKLEELEELERKGLISEEEEQRREKKIYENTSVEGHRLDMDFIGSNSNIKIEEYQELEGYTNYYFPHCSDGITHVNSYNQIKYKNLYDNIDIMFYGDKTNGLKYDFIVNPGGKTSDIKFHYSGMRSIRKRDGKLIINTNIGDVEESMPEIYQEINGKHIRIEGQYILEGSDVQLEIGNYNKNYPLIIDPFTTWITYYGTNRREEAEGIATDASGNVVFTGTTGSNAFPVSAGPFQDTRDGPNDVFVVKFNSGGGREWATYYGGGHIEFGRDITTDLSGNVIFTGYTASTDFPVVNAHQNTSGGNNEAFVVKLNAAGARQWATYYGGSSAEIGLGVGADASGNIYLGGQTNSNNFPVAGAFQATKSTLSDAFLVKFNSTGARQWATYYGGNNVDEGRKVSVDGLGNVYLIGITASTNFPVAGAFQGANGGNDDAFLVKFNSAGARQWATYYGGSEDDASYGVDIDGSNNVYIAGQTVSTNFPVSGGAFQGTNAGGEDAFIAKFNSAGARQWSTYYGGDDDDEGGFGIAVDAEGNSYITGDSYSPSLPGLMPNACQGHGGDEDNYMASFNSNGGIICATYVGAGGHDEERAASNIALSGDFTYIVGVSVANNYPTTAGSFQTTYGGGGTSNAGDAIVAQIPITCECTPLSISSINFRAQKENSNVLIEWTTTNENDITTFEVMKSSDNQNYTNIGKLEPNEYNFLDTDPFLGKSYYKLKIIRKDNSIKYSEISSVYFNEVNLVNLYPNPSKNNINLEISSKKEDEIKLKIVNIAGQTVYKNDENLVIGSNRLSINVKDLPKGIYILEITSTISDFTILKEFEKQ